MEEGREPPQPCCLPGSKDTRPGLQTEPILTQAPQSTGIVFPLASAPSHLRLPQLPWLPGLKNSTEKATELLRV